MTTEAPATDTNTGHTNSERPSGLRSTVNTVTKSNRKLKIQNETLIRLVLFQRFKDGDLDFVENEYLLENYRPQPIDNRDYADKFSVDALRAFLVGRNY